VSCCCCCCCCSAAAILDAGCLLTLYLPFLYSQYDGDKWDNFYEKIPISLLHHTNGNAIYNTSHPLLERLVGQLEVEAPCPYNSIPYDYRMSQMWVEGTFVF
jgi:hypothetical protein